MRLFDDVVKGGVGVAVPAAGGAVSVGASGTDGDWGRATQGGERGAGAQPVGVVTGHDQQVGADDWTYPLHGHWGGNRGPWTPGSGYVAARHRRSRRISPEES